MAKKSNSGVSPPTVKRGCNFAFLLYPESAGDYKSICKKLLSLRVQCLLSPLHDPDEDEKKPHYHVCLFFSSLKSCGQVLDIIQGVFGTINFEGKTCQVVSHVEIINDKVSMIRYLIHWDNPDKQQWFPRDCIHITQINFHSPLRAYFYENNLPLDLVIAIAKVRELNIFTFAELVIYATDNNDYELLAACRSYHHFLAEFIKSYAYLMRDLQRDEEILNWQKEFNLDKELFL